MIHDLYVALCAYYPKSNHLLSPYIWPPSSFTILPLPSLLVTTMLLSVCVYEFQVYIPHMSEIMWFLAFSDGLISLSIIFSRSMSQMAEFLLLQIEREGEGGRKRGRETSMCGCSCVPPTGDLACNPGMCRDWESNQTPLVLRLVLNPLSCTSQGSIGSISSFLMAE